MHAGRVRPHPPLDGALFQHDKTHGISWLEKAPALFGWFAHSVGKITWYSGKSMVQKNEVFEELRRTSTRFTAVEDMPHEPPMAGHYYACDTIEPGDGSHLRQLIERFAPETDIDRDLLRAAFLTPAWGGPAGCRPCYVVTSDDGRGVGKSTVAETIGR